MDQFFNKEPYIIAEIGVNHDGFLNKAIKLIEAASKCGANAVKFQSYKTKDVAVKNAPKANYQKNTTLLKESQIQMLQKLEINSTWYPILRKCCDENNLDLISTPTTIDDAILLKKYNFDVIKLASLSAVEFNFIKQLAIIDLPILFSTGMCSMEEIEDLYSLASEMYKNFALLHCTSSYPTKIEEANISVLLYMIKKYKCKVGFSDHTIDDRIAFAAASINCSLFERHFTLNKNDDGPDHSSSSDPNDFKKYIESINCGIKAKGSLLNKPSFSEKENIFSMRRCMRYAHDLPKGHKLSSNDICLKRPMEGILGNRFFEFEGKCLKKSVKFEECLSFEHI